MILKKMNWVRNLILEFLIINSTSATNQSRCTAGWISEPSTEFSLTSNPHNHPVADFKNANRHIDLLGNCFVNVSPVSIGNEKSLKETSEVADKKSIGLFGSLGKHQKKVQGDVLPSNLEPQFSKNFNDQKKIKLEEVEIESQRPIAYNIVESIDDFSKQKHVFQFFNPLENFPLPQAKESTKIEHHFVGPIVSESSSQGGNQKDYCTTKDLISSLENDWQFSSFDFNQIKSSVLDAENKSTQNEDSIKQIYPKLGGRPGLVNSIAKKYHPRETKRKYTELQTASYVVKSEMNESKPHWEAAQNLPLEISNCDSRLKVPEKSPRTGNLDASKKPQNIVANAEKQERYPVKFHVKVESPINMQNCYPEARKSHLRRLKFDTKILEGGSMPHSHMKEHISFLGKTLTYILKNKKEDLFLNTGDFYEACGILKKNTPGLSALQIPDKMEMFMNDLHIWYEYCVEGNIGDTRAKRDDEMSRTWSEHIESKYNILSVRKENKQENN
ncbi:hypothetical protein PGTUg99_021664 [Puccinia graminis f. sp. tritici]|uniref:Uncharacterized protein n=1 Tax=Puccinia graminis f. sp. tritici TaxID=56615 RepID=A0A5B0M7H4_PUCGR|nr:hypothetical protein PGTUg99_021664 [Puccinia graminis f. sp. tritici]